jgi:hypothetical protein
MEFSSDEEELLLLVGCSEVINKEKRKKRTRKLWVNPYLADRKLKGRFSSDVSNLSQNCWLVLKYSFQWQFQDMRNNPAVFKENFHMMPAQFDYLLSLMESELSPKVPTRPMDGYGPTEKLAMTLE